MFLPIPEDKFYAGLVMVVQTKHCPKKNIDNSVVKGEMLIITIPSLYNSVLGILF